MRNMTGMSMKNGLLLVLVSAWLTGCGMFGGGRVDYQSGADRARALEVPPDLILPQADDRYTIPEGGKSTSYSEYAKREAELKAAQAQNCACRDATTAAAPAPQAAPGLVDVAGGGKMIALAEPFDRCWLRVEQGITRAKLEVEDKDRSKGLWYLADKRQLLVRAAGQGCEVVAQGGSQDANNRTLDTLYKNFGR